MSLRLEETIDPGRRLTIGRRVAVLALLAGGLALLAALDASVAAGPAFALSLAAARLVRP